mgnify:CR=1 FL=1
MKKLSSFLFPPPMLIIGAVFIILGIVNIFSFVTSSRNEEEFKMLAFGIAFCFIGLILLTSRSHLILDFDQKTILKTMRVLGFNMSDEKIKIPEKNSKIIAYLKTKRGKGYVSLVIPFYYNIRSCTLYFSHNRKFKKIITTNLARAKTIGILLQKETGMDFEVKTERSK